MEKRDDPLVSVYRGARGEAEVIASMLRSSGVDALISTDDADGWYPHVGFVQGTRVLVFASEESLARRLILEAEPLTAE